METVKEIKAELNRPRKPKKNILMKQQSLVMNNRLFIFVIPALLIFAIFWIWPFLKLFTFSVTDFNGFNMNYNNVGFNNFKSIIESGTLTNSIKNTLIYTVLLVIVGNILTLICSQKNTKLNPL